MKFKLDTSTPKVEPDSNPDSKSIAIVDLDYLKYKTASVAEVVTIDVKNIKTGRVKEFKNISTFRGLGKKVGGWLGDLNDRREAKGNRPFTLDEFEVTKVQKRKKEFRQKRNGEGDLLFDSNGEAVMFELSDEQSLGNILHSTKKVILSDLKKAGTDNYFGVLGKGDSFRVELSTLRKYKGNRDNLLKPLVIDDITSYLKRSFDATEVTGIEADDFVVMKAYNNPDAFVMGEDKDYYGQPVRFFNVNRPEEGIIDCDCFGKLWLEGSKEKVRGYGRIFLYWQIISEDNIDNYKANCFSKTKWAGKSAYKALCNCKDDKEALEVCIEVFKKLYPKPIIITGWRGDDFKIDWYYVFNEMFNMARMQRWEGDIMSLSEWLEEYGGIVWNN